MISSYIPEDIKKPIRFLRYLIHIPYAWSYCTLQGVKWQYGWEFHGCPIITKTKNAHITIGTRFVAVSKSKYNTLGVFQPVILKAVGENSEIVIGDDVGISGSTISAIESIYIGNNVLIGSGALITDNDAHAMQAEGRRYSVRNIKSAPIMIEDNVFIGARAIVLKGVKIRKGSVVGAGCVVVKDVPQYTIVAGNPAKIIGNVEQ
jgi:acetyltransferase-like isoleucine patch superfamily enzyme